MKDEDKVQNNIEEVATIGRLPGTMGVILTSDVAPLAERLEQIKKWTMLRSTTSA